MNKTAQQAVMEQKMPSFSFDSFLEKLGVKDRLNAEKHVAACGAESDPQHAALWRRLAAGMMGLAGHSAKINGQQSAQFYTADGKYRMQVFALEDQRQGEMNVFCRDVLEEALKAAVLTPDSAPGVYRVEKSRDTLRIRRLDGGTPDPAPYFKDMLGWNRKAIHVVVPNSASPAQVKAIEWLCARSVAAK